MYPPRFITRSTEKDYLKKKKTAEQRLCMSSPQSRNEGRPETVANMMLRKYGTLPDRGV